MPFTFNDREREREMQTYIHFNGYQNGTCRDGVAYDDVTRPHTDEERAEYRRKRAEAPAYLQRSSYAAAEIPDDWGTAYRRPCTVLRTREDKAMSPEERVELCPCLALPTSEDIDRREAEIQRGITRSITARRAIMDFLKEEGKLNESVRGHIPCPCCAEDGETGTLHFRYAGSYNKHLHAECSSEGCVNWME